ncbi:unnamed protein product [Vitrella brassicaformis CCMP3155]|uniref:Uncharacterized protein n=2 Tax=Vitrella brassicaformis TaxID=1169539 RepID=A0A0G4FAL0_VITBC|nr:unnamed protein product [Vitrella brassicaformis CCMP3155]|eukprot:CEM09636.1 unnamed protein product [Vitrella brassicaformis CCMP3155]
MIPRTLLLTLVTSSLLSALARRPASRAPQLLAFQPSARELAKVYGRLAGEGVAARLLENRPRIGITQFVERLPDLPYSAPSTDRYKEQLTGDISREFIDGSVVHYAWEALSKWKGELTRDNFEVAVAELTFNGFDSFCASVSDSLSDFYPIDQTPGKSIIQDAQPINEKLQSLSRDWENERLEREIEEARLTGWSKGAELINGRTAMFFVATGLLTEFWTGQSIPEQIQTLFQTLGVAPPS